MRYAAMVFAFTLTILSVVGTITYTVDPYRAFHLKDVTTRGDLIYYMRLIKPYQLRQFAGDLLILGSSRASKLRPESVSIENTSGYNAALPGMTSYEMLTHLRHADALGRTRTLIIGLDFAAYLDSNSSVQFGYNEARLEGSKASATSRTKAALRDRQQLLLSGSAIADALHIAAGTQRRDMHFFGNGTWAMSAASQTFSREQKFFQIGTDYYLRAHRASQTHDLTHLRALVRYAHQNAIDTRFFVSPVHLLTLFAYQNAGQLEHYLRWQTDVLRLLQEEATHAQAEAFPLYGFQSDDAAATESMTFPPETAYYEDAVHYSFDYGDIILSEIERAHPKRATRLTRANVTAYWAQVLESLDEFQLNNAGFIGKFESRLNRSN